jgi:hypothetical protein
LIQVAGKRKGNKSCRRVSAWKPSS